MFNAICQLQGQQLVTAVGWRGIGVLGGTLGGPHFGGLSLDRDTGPHSAWDPWTGRARLRKPPTLNPTEASTPGVGRHRSGVAPERWDATVEPKLN
ncbi:hypothetical protein FKM82_022896 [Ascaphus truei]